MTGEDNLVDGWWTSGKLSPSRTGVMEFLLDVAGAGKTIRPHVPSTDLGVDILQHGDPLVSRPCSSCLCGKRGIGTHRTLLCADLRE